MAKTPWFSPARNILCICLIGLSAATPASAGDFSFSAKVDKTTVAIGEPIQLTFTLSGDIAEASVPPLQLPEGFVVMAQSRSTNFSIRAGAAERSSSLVYVVVPQKAGVFHLGPFTVTRKKQAITAEAIEINVKPPVSLPAQQRPDAQRFTL